jgi:hypothetical protein
MNDSKSQPSDRSPDLTALQSRVSRIQSIISAQEQRLARATRLTAWIGGIVCIAVICWFTLGYVKLNEFLEPNQLANYATDMLMTRLRTQRQEAEDLVKEQAPEWAETVSQQVQENIPDVRMKMEDFIMAKADEAMDHVQVVTADQFRAFVTDNSGMLRDGFTSLKKPEEAEQFVQDLHKAVETEMGRDMREQSQEMLHMIYDLNAKLEKLKSGQKLNGEQALEREILMIAKRLQEESQDDRPMKRLKKTTPLASQDESEPDAPAPKAADAADKKTEEPKTGDNETKAEKPADSKAKPDDGDKPAKDNPEKKATEEKAAEKENKSGDK